MNSVNVIKENRENKYDGRYEFKAVNCMKLCLKYFTLEDKPEKLLLINKNFYQRL